MLKITFPDRDTGIEPRPCFATDADLLLAQRLREELEERYFGRTMTLGSSRAQADEMH
jgi:hypothetical protein